MVKTIFLRITPLVLLFYLSACDKILKEKRSDSNLTGTESCRDCHEDFYSIWDNSPHSGSARPLLPSFIEELYFDHDAIIINGKSYLPEREGDLLIMNETDIDGVSNKIQPVAVLGSRDHCYFLSRSESGAFSLLPLAYSTRERTWFRMRDSLYNHCNMTREEFHAWEATDRLFSTTCYSCHVNPANSHYNPATNSYLGERFEEGVSCESCHGPADEHDKAMRALAPGEEAAELLITRVSAFSHQQVNDLCSSCHMTAQPLTATYPPGKRYLDHFMPEIGIRGTDTSTNRKAYLYSDWEMNPCRQSGKLDCLHCHDAGGEFRFAAASDNACTSCHQDIAADIPSHSHHPVESEGSRCISCHMTASTSLGERFTDHSFSPPMPLATIRTGLPNACNSCHSERSSWWALSYTRKWYPENYEDSAIYLAQIAGEVDSRNPRKKKELMELIQKDQNPIYIADIIRNIEARKNPNLSTLAEPSINSSSPLVRSAAIEALGHYPNKARAELFTAALHDDFRVVRISAFEALLNLPDSLLGSAQLAARDSMVNQYAAYLLARPDNWKAYNNLGDLFFRTGKYSMALKSYESAIAIDPSVCQPMISAGLSYARGGNLEMAIMMLRRAIELEPGNEVAHWQLALLYLENQQSAFAENEFRKVLDINEKAAPAAYNLAVIISDRSIPEAIRWIRKAIFFAPDEPKYIYTLAFYLNSTGKTTEASGSLRDLIQRVPGYGPAYLLLGSIYEQEGMLKEARQLYMKGLAAPIPESDKSAMSAKLQQVGG